jgi:hypothetical protein
MKTRYLLMLLLGVVTIMLHAQTDTIANGGFEKWDTTGSYSQPHKWYTLNSLTNLGYPPTTTITDDAHSGSYAVVLENKTGPFSDLPGILVTGNILKPNNDIDFSAGKYPFTSKPISVRFYYKVFPSMDDTCAMLMVLTKWNQAFNTADTVAVARMNFTKNVTSYTQADVQFEYLLPFAPDSAFCLFSSSTNAYNPVVGSTFYLDDLELNYTITGLDDLHTTFVSTLYPNPSSHTLNIELAKAGKTLFSLFDLNGKQVDEQIIYQQKNAIDISRFKDGIYIVILKDENNLQSHHKISIQH